LLTVDALHAKRAFLSQTSLNLLLLPQRPTLAPFSTAFTTTNTIQQPRESHNIDEHAKDTIMEEISTTNAHKAMDGQVVNTSQPATSSITQTTLQTQPKTFMNLPRELRDRVYELCFCCEPSVIVFSGSKRPSDYEEGPKNPEMTAQVASKYVSKYPGSYATFGGHATAPTKITNWSQSRTGILYTNKQISSEAVPYLYQSCTFLFEDLDLSKKFLDIVSPSNLELVRSIFIYYPDELEVVYSLTDTPVDNSVPMRHAFHLLCKRIAQTMPKVKDLTIWIGKILELENEDTRCEVYERALLQLADLKEVETLSVKKFSEIFGRTFLSAREMSGRSCESSNCRVSGDLSADAEYKSGQRKSDTVQ
jgi:hypothetical protein